jgi:DNA-binding MarR family transcriptional regulator
MMPALPTDGTSGRQPIVLENQLCFAIYAASRALAGAYRELLKELDLTYPQYIVMLALWEQDGVTISELGRRVLLDFGTLTPLLKRLESRGLLIRRRDPKDERNVRLTITPVGRTVQEQASCIPAALRCQISLTRQETASLREAMKTLINDLTEWGQ